MLTHRIGRITQLLLIPLLIGSAGCQNHNLFSKLHGDSSDPATLTSEAAIALREKDFSKALELSNRVLANDPNNADALYYSASAQMGLTNIDLGTLVSNVLNQVSGSSFIAMNGVAGAIALSRDGVSAQSSCGAAGSILTGVNCDALNSAVDSVIRELNVIASGSAHGTISQNDVPMLIDYGIIRVLRAAVRAILGHYLDLKNDDGNFQVSAGSNLTNLCTDVPTATSIARDLACAYQIFNKVASLLGLSNSSIVVKLREDIREAGDELFARGSSQILPDACYDNIFTPLGANSSNYLSVLGSGAFAVPS